MMPEQSGKYDSQKRSELLAYAREKFWMADSVHFADERAAGFDSNLVQGVLDLKIQGARVLCGFTRELWDHTATFDELRSHMERHHWWSTVNHATEPMTLGETGWVAKAPWR